MESYIIKVHFIPTLCNTILTRNWTLVSNSDIEWVCKHGNFQPQIKDATIAVKGIIIDLRRVLRPLFKMCSQIMVVIRLTGLYGLYTVITISVVIIGVLNIIQYNFKKMKIFEERRTKINELLRSRSSKFSIQMLNGNCEKTINDIVKGNDNMLLISLDHELIMSGLWQLLDGSHYILVILTIMKLSQYIQGKELIAAIIAIYSTCEFTWWTSHTISSLFENASKWGAMEKLLETWKPLVRTTPEPEFNMDDIIPGLNSNEIIRIYGKSGSGKTTWMVKTLIKLFRKYSDIKWTYLDQNMKLNMYDKSIQEVMQECLLLPLKSEILIEYAEKLGLKHLINVNTLEKSFQKPSGGEEKRILLLCGLLPIIHSEGNTKVIFLDEVTSGLDPENFDRVMDVIYEIHKMGIALIIIDHHEFTSVKPTKDIAVNIKFYKLPVIVKEPYYEKCYWRNNSLYEKVKSFISMCWNNQLNQYQQLSTDDNEPKIESITWLDGEIEPALPYGAILVQL
tara:strand:+ start:1931 stop:3454 length:1524 start_codon:yes stop_codon:yes gene_type:complete